MDTNLREDYKKAMINQDTIMSFQKEGDFIKASEKCSGSGDCRKTNSIGGTMCPSYQATRNERDSTRARANILREFLTHQDVESVFESAEVYDVLKLCLSCKACISECPSSVDMAAMKSEFLFQYHKNNPHSRLEKNLANFYDMSKKLSRIARVSNLIQNAPMVGVVIKKFIGMDHRRSLPNYSHQTFEMWWRKNQKSLKKFDKKVYLFVDEFTNFLESEIAIKLIKLLQSLEVEVLLMPMMDSSRSLISKGFLNEAKKNVNNLIEELKMIANDEIPLIGIEPSAILGFRDDYHRLVDEANKEVLIKISKKTALVEEYLSELFRSDESLRNKFTKDKLDINYHGHCHQKSLSSARHAVEILNFPDNYSASEIKSGCCGMAGSFGYEHYELSMQIGEMVLFPEIRNSHKNTIISASGTSCRHQIKDGTKSRSFHPVEILYDALRN
jgi:Fe-S oxidoreductase